MVIRRIARDGSLRCSGKHCARWARWFLLFPSGAIRYYCDHHKERWRTR